MSSTSPEEIISAITEQAKATWGEKWMQEITRRYCEIESAEVGEVIKPYKRRSQLERTLNQNGGCELKSLLRLLAAVGIEMELYVKKRI